MHGIEMSRRGVAALSLVCLLGIPGIVLAAALPPDNPPVVPQGDPGVPEAVVAFDGTSQQPLVVGLRLLVNFLLIIIAIVAAVFLVIGGVRYVTSGGDEDATEKAKNTILFALIGLIVIALASAITNFVLNALVGAQ